MMRTIFHSSIRISVSIFVCLATWHAPCFGEDDWKAGIQVASYEMNGATSVLTLRHLQSRLHRQGTPPFHGESMEDRIAYLSEQTEQLCVDHLLSNLAIDEGLDQDASVRGTIQNETARLTREALFDSILKDATPPLASSIEKYYKSHLEDYREPESFEVLRIFSFCPNMKDEEARSAALNEARKALSQVKAGADFCEVAARISNGPTPNTGDPVLVYPHQLNFAVRSALSGLSPGDVSGIVETSRGYLILKVVQHTPAGYRPLDDELGKQIGERLYTDTKKEIWDSFWNRYMAGKKVFLPYKDIRPSALRDDIFLFGWNGAQFTWQDLKQDEGEDNADQWQSLGDEEFQSKAEEAFKKRIQENAAIELGFAESDKVKFESAEFAATTLASHYLPVLTKADEIEPSSQELRVYYRENPTIFQSKEEKSIRILKFLPLAGDGTITTIVTPAAKSAAYWKAQEVYRKLTEGESFDAVQSNYAPVIEASTDGFRPMGPRGHKLDMALEGLAVGQVCKPVEVKDGFLLIQVTGIKQPQMKPFDEVAEIARLQLRYRKNSEARKRLLSSLLERHHFHLDERNIRIVAEKYFDEL